MKLIALHSMPRSGSTWLGSIIDSCPNVIYKMQPLFAYALKGFLDQDSDYEKISSFKQRLLSTEDDFMDQTEKKAKNIIPEFKKEKPMFVAYKETRYHYILENLIKTDPEVTAIGLIRNPLAHLFSWFNAPKEFRHELGWKIEEEWRTAPKKNNNKPEEYYGYEKWKATTHLFHSLNEKYPTRFQIVKYTNLLNNTRKVVEELFMNISLPFTEQTSKFINASRNHDDNDPYGVFKIKSKDDAWKGKLPEYIVKFITEDLENSYLKEYLDNVD